uniref:(northern house mosquito) hypothetical protein n=1 Tax=Culex pipiens TaxID=7175 RepID=A0A8D8L632_CULPI
MAFYSLESGQSLSYLFIVDVVFNFPDYFPFFRIPSKRCQETLQRQRCRCPPPTWPTFRGPPLRSIRMRTHRSWKWFWTPTKPPPPGASGSTRSGRSSGCGTRCRKRPSSRFCCPRSSSRSKLRCCSKWAAARRYPRAGQPGPIRASF